MIDPDRLRLHKPGVSYDLPAGGRRIGQGADGFDATIVSGVPTAFWPGRPVRGFTPSLQ